MIVLFHTTIIMIIEQKDHYVKALAHWFAQKYISRNLSTVQTWRSYIGFRIGLTLMVDLIVFNICNCLIVIGYRALDESIYTIKENYTSYTAATLNMDDAFYHKFLQDFLCHNLGDTIIIMAWERELCA